jgi:histidinol-phosphate/aromatic aminotransferase/cobyric acid decarboxylase-like protein/choline kinase
LILAAGMGSRLGKYTENNTKCMVEVGGVPLIGRALDILKGCGISKVVIVVGYEADNLMSYVNGVKGIEPEFIFNKDYDRTNNIYSLYLARDALLRDDTILLESDVIFDSVIIERLVGSKGDLAVVDKYAYWMDGTTVTIDERGIITEFVDKKDMSPGMFGEYYKTVNIYKLTKSFSRKYFVPEMESYIEKEGRGVYYELALKVLSHSPSSRLKAMRISEGERWYEIDDPKDLDVARTMFPDGDALDSHTKRYGGFWRFPYLLDFCYLVNPYFPPKFMIKEMASMTERLVTSYPSGMGVQCLNAGVLFGIDREKILVGNGAAELINGLEAHVGRTVGVCVPTFDEYIRCFRGSEIKEIHVSETGYLMNEKTLTDALDVVDTLVIISPNNPCGDILEYEAVIRILDRARELGKRVIFDESFIDFAVTPYTLMDQKVLDRYPGLAVVKSISKSYGVPGVRLGVLATSDAALLDDMRKRMSVWNINSFGEFFLQIAGKYADRYRKGCELLRKERRRFMKRLSGIPGLTVFPSQANYLFCGFEGTTAPEVTEMLLREHGILIKDLTGKPGIDDDRRIRIAVRDTKDNDRLADALSEILIR